MTWWTEPDPQRSAPTPESVREDAPTVRFTTVDVDEAVTVSYDAAPAPVDLTDDASTRVMPTALVPERTLQSNDAPTMALQPVRRSPAPVVDATAAAMPLDPMFGPRSPQELRPPKHRKRAGLSAFGWFRLLLALPLLTVGTIGLAAGLAPALDNLGAVWSPTTGFGALAVLLGWMLLPGSAIGTAVALLLSFAAWGSALIAYWILGSEQLLAAIGPEPTSVMIDWIIPGVVLVGIAVAWLAARGKHGASVVVLAVPIALVVAAGLMAPAGWFFGDWDQSLWGGFTTALATAAEPWFAGWPELGAELAAGISGWLQIAAVMVPVMLLAWPLQRR